MQTLSVHPWRRILHVSLRSLMVVVLVIGGWLGWMVHQARVQRDAVAAVRKLQGTALYDWERKDGRAISNGKPWGAKVVCGSNRH